jgi:deoxyribodipyrimidine photolyase
MVDHPSPMLDHLDLPDALKYRVLCRNSPSADETETTTTTSKNKKSFILYLPSVVLRKRHNAGFALACHLANHHKVPVLVLCSVLDDQMLSKEPLSPTVMTARRLAFTLEALQSCCNDFEEHGAGVAIRVHGPGARTPHHLSLAHKALAVVTDEPFVDPFRQYVQKVVKTCRSARVPCFSVDSSTSVPPKQFLKLSTTQTVDGDLQFTGAPNKAWRWEKQTSNCRQWHVFAATREGALDAPELKAKLPPNFFLSDDNAQESVNHDNLDTTTESLMAAIPSKWKDSCVPCPSQRPWTATELHAIAPKEWAMTEWEGADTSVSPCQQTHGSSESAKRRWKSFLETGLKEYAKKRNQIVLPQAVSRISCYLNLGILSVFDVLDDIWQAKSSRTGYSTGCQKFLDEIVKWREGSYVHAFAHPKYHSIEVLPPWSRRHLESLRASSCSASTGYTYEQLESSTTADETWNAMQSYLVETGELHNNARMTW